MPSTRHAVLGIILDSRGQPRRPGTGRRGRCPGRGQDRRPHRRVLPPADEDYFHGIDNGLALTPDEIKGRNMWLVWTGGNDRFWDRLTHDTFGAFDLLKTISSHPEPARTGRSNRWYYLGLINEPCFDEATGPDPDALRPVARPAPRRLPGRSLRQRRRSIPASPSARAGKQRAGRLLLRRADRHPGPAPVPQPRLRRGGGRRTWDRGAVLQRSRLLLTPRTWSGPTGSACPAPSAMSARARSPRRRTPRTRQWENINATVGVPVFLDRPNLRLGSRRPATTCTSWSTPSGPGTLDTSLVSTDYINNPRTMNAIYNLGPRLGHGQALG